MKSRQFYTAALMLCAGTASAQSTWNNSAGGDWNTAANWTPGTIPLIAGDSAAFPTLASPYDVLCNTNPAIDSLTIAGPNQRLIVDANRTLSILTAAGVENHGELLINPSMSVFNTALNFQSTTGITSLFGTGHTRLNGNTDANDARIRVITGTTLSILQPVRGSGRILSDGLTDNRSTIEADMAGFDLQISGTMTQSAAGSLQGIGGGFVALSNATITGGSFLGGVEAGTGSTISSVILSGANGVRSNNTFNIGAPGIQNDGVLTVNVQGQVFNAVINSAAAVTISGSGTIDLNGSGSDPGDAVLRSTTGNPMTVGMMQTVSGNGRIDAPESMTFRGIALADRVGEDLHMVGTFDFDMLGRAQSSGGIVLLNNASVTDGSFEGDVDTVNTSTIIGCQNTGMLRVRENSTLFIENTLLNSSNIIINHVGSVFDSFLRAPVDTAITGTGTITLNGPLNIGDAQLDVDDLMTLTVGANQIIEGTGRVDATGAVVMNGIYRGNVAGLDLVMTGTHDLSGGGQVEGTGGGFALFSAADVTGGTFNGGVHTGNVSTMRGFTNSGSFAVRNNSTLFIDNNFTNNGVMTVNLDASVFNSVMRISADTTVAGAGTITLNGPLDLGDAQLDIDDLMTLTVGANQVIEGTGRVDANGAVVMNGVYRGNVAGLDLVLTGTHDLSGGGQAEGVSGGIALFSNADVTGGTFNGGVDSSGVTTMRGFTNNGSFGIRDSSTLVIDGAMTNTDTITINTAGNLFNARLEAAAPITIDGVIVLNGASDPGDAELRANETAGGSINLPATSTVTGNAGRLNGPIDARGTLTPGVDDLTAGTFHLQQDITFFGTSAVVLDFEETDSVVSFDKITGTSTLILDGTIELRLQGGYEPAIGDTFTIVDAGTVTGVFATTNTPLIGTHLFRVIENAGDVTALWTCLGDVNLDGALTPTDFTAWIAAFNSGNVEVGDQNLDGFLTPTDFTAWIINFNAGC